MQLVEFPDVPPSANGLRIPAHGRLITAPKYRAWQDVAGWTIREAGLIPVTRYPVHLTIELLGGTVRRDLDNIAKPIIDALVKGEILREDNVAHVSEITLRYIAWTTPGGVRVYIQEAL